MVAGITAIIATAVVSISALLIADDIVHGNDSFIASVGAQAGEIAANTINAIANSFPSHFEMIQNTIAQTEKRIAAGGIAEEHWRHNSVYVLHSTNINRVFYVGITNSPGVRNNAHQKDPRFVEMHDFNLIVVTTGLNRLEALAVEQTLIAGYSIEQLKNIRNAIAEGRYDQFTKEARIARKLILRW